MEINKHIICITGMDGTGKTTLINSLLEFYPQAHVANVWDLLDTKSDCLPFSSKKNVDNFLALLTPDSRLLFLAHVLKFSIDKALEKQSDMILLNGYYYKYFCSELALGANTKLVESLQDIFPEPDLVIELFAQAEDIAERKPHFSRYECGFQRTDKESFISFQSRIKPNWNRYDSSKWLRINTNQNQDEVLLWAKHWIETLKKSKIFC